MQGPDYNLQDHQTKTCRATTKAVEVGGLQFEANLGKGYWDPVSKTSWKPGAGDLLRNSTEVEIRRIVAAGHPGQESLWDPILRKNAGYGGLQLSSQG
jgi:hypothetical protein